jgi:hypothetical protein
VRLGRARHHRRIPLPGRLCCDPARSTSTCCRSHEASAGGPSCACVNRYFHDRADDGHIGLPAAVPSRQSHTREPTVPSGTARKSQIAITASPIRPHQNLQIPITSHLCPAGSCLGGFRTPAPCLSLDLRGPASENLHHVGRSAGAVHFSKADINAMPNERNAAPFSGERSLHIYDYSIPAQAKHQAGAFGFQMQDHARLVLHPQIATTCRAKGETIACLSI